jgi:hypothetical protein
MEEWEEEIRFRDVRFRISEIADWVQGFVRLGNVDEARHWSRELVRIARQLPEFPQ